MMNNYVNYHLHTENSLLDSCTNYKLYIDKAKELGQKAICFTEHGNIYNWYKKKMYCDEQGIKYLHGIECYITETFDENIRDNMHTILIAKNMKGFEELNKLIFISTHKDHFYYKPRLSFDEFLDISDNIIKISACIQSPLYQYKNKLEKLRDSGIDIKDKMDKYIQVAKHYDYYEIQYHTFDAQIKYNQYLYKLSKMYNKPLIVGCDTHSLNQYKAECRIILKYGKTDGDWGDSENSCDLTYHDYDSVVNDFKKQDSLPMDIVLEALNNTNIMADSCDDIIIDTSVKYPILYEGQDEEQIMWDRLRKMYMDKVNNGIIDGNNKKYSENIKEEMRVFKKINMVGFMLFMSEMMDWCRQNHIFTSPCRGSVGGSTVAYISNIIDVDPIKRNTVFSRFANEDRREVGDIDCDFYDDDRQKVYDYIFNRFGKEKTAYILAVGTLANKSVIDVIGKAFRKLSEEKGETTQYTLDKIKDIKAEYEKNPQVTRDNYSDLFYYYDGLVGCVISQSQHPAGVVASPINLINNYSMFVGSDNQYILPIDMDEVHEIGLVKYDILGLKNVGIISKTCEYAHIPLPYSHMINWDDQNVFKDMITSPIGIFQFEGQFAFDSLKKYKVKSIDDMSIVNACIRPSGESYRDDLLARKPHKNPSKIIDDLLSANAGYLIFQEDTIKFLQQICGLSGSDADNVRRAIGRKQTDRLQKALPQILEGYCKKSPQPREVAEKEAKEFLQIIEDSASYQFGFNHSTGYSMVGYLCAYMRYYYPIEFCTAFLNCSKTDEDIYNGTILAKQKGANIVNPKFRKSLSDFSCDVKDKKIYKGIGSIKDIGKNCGNNLYKLKDNHYDTFVELLDDIKKNSLSNKTEMDILIKIDFFNEFGDIHLLEKIRDLYDKYGSRNTLKKKECDEIGIDYDIVRPYCEKETDKQFSKVNMINILKQLINTIEYKKTQKIEHIMYEIKYLGYTNLIDENQDDNIFVVSNIETNKYDTPFANLYQANNGNISQYKVNKKWYNEYKLNNGDIIRATFKTKNKKIKVDDKWIKSDEIENVLESYFIIKGVK